MTHNETILQNLLYERELALASGNTKRLEYLEIEIAVIKAKIEKERVA